MKMTQVGISSAAKKCSSFGISVSSRSRISTDWYVAHSSPMDDPASVFVWWNSSLTIKELTNFISIRKFYLSHNAPYEMIYKIQVEHESADCCFTGSLVQKAHWKFVLCRERLINKPTLFFLKKKKTTNQPSFSEKHWRHYIIDLISQLTQLEVSSLFFKSGLLLCRKQFPISTFSCRMYYYETRYPILPSSNSPYSRKVGITRRTRSQDCIWRELTARKLAQEAKRTSLSEDESRIFLPRYRTKSESSVRTLHTRHTGLQTWPWSISGLKEDLEPEYGWLCQPYFRNHSHLERLFVCSSSTNLSSSRVKRGQTNTRLDRNRARDELDSRKLDFEMSAAREEVCSTEEKAVGALERIRCWRWIRDVLLLDELR